MKPKTQWLLDKEHATPFDTLNQFDRIVGEQCRENKTWRTIAIISISAFFLALGIMIWSIIKDASEKKYVPIIISVNDVGETSYHGAANKINYDTLKVTDDMIKFQIKNFIINANSIPKDAKVFKDNLSKCYSNLTKSTSNKFSREIQKNKILDKFGVFLRSVKIESIIQVSEKSYQIDYTVIETSASDNLSSYKQTKYRTVMMIAIQEPTEKDIERNPAGIYITDYGTTVLSEKVSE